MSERPDFLESSDFLRAQQEFTDWVRSGGTRSKGGRSPLRRLIEPFEHQIREALHEDFGGLCAFTETPDHSMIRLRPAANAMGLDGRVHGDHYWWMAFEWDNWYLVSAHLASVKGSSFPVIGDRMAEPDVLVNPLEFGALPLDQGLLLDPCRDEPARWLRFDEDGSVASRTPSMPNDRGLLSISVYDLDNAGELRGLRREAIRDAMRQFPALHKEGELIRALDWLDGAQRPPHGGAIAQVLIRRHVTLSRGLSAALATRLLDGYAVPFVAEAAPVAHRFDRSDPDVESGLRMLTTLAFAQCGQIGELDGVPELSTAPVRMAPPQVRMSPSDVLGAAEAAMEGSDELGAEFGEDDAGQDLPPLRPVDSSVVILPTNRIRHIEIKNFRAIEHVTLDVDEEDVTLAGLLELSPADEEEFRTRQARRWRVLLGENGSGKSSILNAIALALCGPEIDRVMHRVALTWKDIYRWGATDQGKVRLDFTGGQRIDLRFDVDGHHFEDLGDAAPEINVNVRGFGSTRFPASDRRGLSEEELLARARQPQGGTARNIDNLLDTTIPILSAKAWLESLSQEAFYVAAETLGDLLGDLPDRGEGLTIGQRIERDPDDPSNITVDGDRLALVSDGYRSVISLGCEIMASIGGVRDDDETEKLELDASDFRDATGIVLIDEIGAHLHPRWRMQITGKLRAAFPSVQFFVTTHEPLCLRGLDTGEVTRVVKYREHGVVLDEIDRAPGRYRVDQLLTSEFFGLDSAIDPRVDKVFAEYYALKRQDELSSVEISRLADLDEQINEKALRPILGYTRRDQLIYEAIDRYLIADKAEADDPKTWKKRREEIVADIAEIWNRSGA
ncbi:MAG: AAA family ATPase [Actinomycetota bacterium]